MLLLVEPIDLHVLTDWFLSNNMFLGYRLHFVCHPQAALNLVIVTAL